MRYKLVVILVLVLVFALLSADSEIGDFRKIAGGEESYAWNDNYLFVASSYRLENELEDWEAWHYSISSIDRQTKEKRLLVKEVYGRYVSLLTDGDELYILWEMEGECYSVGVMKLSIQSGSMNLVTTLNLEQGEHFRDAIIFNGTIILITNIKVMEWDFYKTKTLHIFRGKAGNSLYHNHVIIDEDILYCLDDNTIWAIDLITQVKHEVRKISTIESMSFKYRTDRQRLTSWKYDYIITRGTLYYYDTDYGTDCRATVAVDLLDSKSTKITDDEVYFYSITNDQVVYSIITLIDWQLSASTYILDVSKNERLDLEHGEKIEWFSNEVVPISNDEYYKPNTSELIKMQ